ncbi:hypothetical protein OJAV_G00164470 [Oryzias javanicus]|uniref:B box-type domain-containing protein n=1 Tax=Oryzias javanicus TaxID=123683 RepID=A0A437CKQ8_ORYJA|nr:hypothetical protein OJAV_G00164470 [Oryzias javanicus]
MTSVDSTEPEGDFPAKKCGSCDGGPARCWCVDCGEALCQDCASAHRRVTVTRRHRLLDQAPAEVFSIFPTKFCSLHPSEALRLFCFRCNQLTCRDCQLVSHKNHSFEFISKAVESLKKQLGSSVQPLQEQMKASRRSILHMEERLAVLSQHETFVQTKLQRNFSVLAEFLSRRLEKVLKEVQKIHGWERQRIQARMLEVRELQRGCTAVTAAAAQAQNATDLPELLGRIEQIKPQVKELVSQDSAPPETMACLKVVTDQRSMESILQFGKIEVTWVPFSSSFHEVAPPTSSSSSIAPPTSSSFSSIAPPTSSSFSNIAPPTSSFFSSIAPPTSSSFSNIAPPTSSSLNRVAPPTSSSFSSIAPPTSSSLNRVAPPTSSSFSNIAPPTSSFFSNIAPPTSSSFSSIAPPTSSFFSSIAPPTSSFFSSIAPPTSSSLNRVAPPTSFSFSNIAPPTSSSFSNIAPPTSSSFSSIAPPTSSPPAAASPLRLHLLQAPLLLHRRLLRVIAPNPPPFHTGDAPPPAPPGVSSSAPADSSQLQPPSAQTQPTPSLLVSSSTPSPSSLDPPSISPSSKVQINVISRSEVAALSRLFQWPIKERDPPGETPKDQKVLRRRLHGPPGQKSQPPLFSVCSWGADGSVAAEPPLIAPQGPPAAQRPPHTPQRSRDRPPSLEEPDPSWTGPSESYGLWWGGPGSSPAAEPSEPAPSLSVEPEPAERPGSPSTEEVRCGGPGPDGGAGTRGGGARLLQPRVSLFRLPVSWSGPGRPLPRFRLTLGDAADEIYMQELAQSPLDSPGSPRYRQNSDFTEPLSLEILSCSSCGASDASKICVSCGRGFHRDCHVPPVGPDIWSEWICSLCQDLSDPTDPFGSDRPAGPQTSGLGRLDQRKCETLVLHLLVESCGRPSQSGFLLDLNRISERLTRRALPGFQRAEDLVSELWTLMEESSQDDALNDLRESFQRKMKDTFGSQLPPLLRRASDTPPGAGGGGSPTRGASGPKEVDAEMLKVRGEAELTGGRSKLEVLRKRLRDFLDTKQLPPGKRMKTD